MCNLKRFRWLALAVWFALLVTVGSAASAQAWRGSTAFDIEILREKKPAVDVEVVLVFLELDAKAGPAPARTNSRGVATLEGLASGRWRLEIRVDGKSPYSAVIQLAAGEKTLVVAGPVRDAAAPAMTVKLGKGRLSSSPAAQPSEPVSKPPLPTPPTSPPTAQPTPQPQPSVAPAPAPAPAPPPPVQVPVSPSLTPPPPAQPEPTAPPPAAQPPGTPTPVAPPPEPPASVARGNAGIVAQCPECKPGEQALAVVQVAGPAGSPTCEAEAAIQAAIKRLGATDAAGSLRGFTGALVDPATGLLPATVPPQAASDVLALLAPFLDPRGPCQLLAAVLPPSSKYSGYAYEASDRTGGGACVGGESCEIGQAAWTDHPTVKKTPEATFLYGVFRNLSPNLERRAKLVVYFRP